MNVSAISSRFSACTDTKKLRACALVLRNGVYVNVKRSAVPNQAWGNNLGLALSLSANWESLGYEISNDLLHALSRSTDRTLAAIDTQLSQDLAVAVGAHRAYKPMYPNFPKQVMKTSDVERFINAQMHYMGDLLGLRILPMYETKARKKDLKDRDVQHRPLRLVTPDDLAQSFVDHLSMMTAWAPNVRKTMADLIGVLGSQDQAYAGVMIPNKENLAVAAASFHRVGVSPQVIAPSLSSVTDILRIGVALGSAEGDVSLADKTKMRLGSFKRNWRRTALSFIEQSKDQEQVLENLRNRRMAFVRLGEVLHPGEYADRFPQAFAAFDALRDAKKLRALSYTSKLEAAFIRGEKGMSQALALLQTRPGVFARRIVALLVKGNASVRRRALASFADASAHVATPLLLDLRAFVMRGMDNLHRTAMPKGAISKVYVRQSTANVLDDELRLQLVAILDNALQTKFAQLPALGKVYVNPDVRNMLMPYGLRNAPEGTKTLVRGSRIPLGAQEDDIVRCFMWWKEPQYDRVDLDLSVVLLDDAYNVTEHCSWTQLRGDGMTHSGDITSAPNGACEFIDVKLSKVAKRARYMLMVVNAYTNTPFAEVCEEAFAGWMVRAKGQHGEIFDPRTVHHKADLVTNGRVAMPMMIDLQTREAVWLDLGVKSMNVLYASGYGRYGSSRSYKVENQASYLSCAVQGLATLAKPTIGEVIDAHLRARGGKLVDSKEGADLVIDWDGEVTPFDHAVWSAKWAGA